MRNLLLHIYAIFLALLRPPLVYFLVAIIIGIMILFLKIDRRLNYVWIWKNKNGRSFIS